MSDSLWLDEGPISQGKIITAALKLDLAEARRMLHGWSSDDLLYLGRALDQVNHQISKELAARSFK